MPPLTLNDEPALSTAGVGARGMAAGWLAAGCPGGVSAARGVDFGRGVGLRLLL